MSVSPITRIASSDDCWRMLIRFCWVRNASLTIVPAIKATTMAGTRAISCSTRAFMRCRMTPADFFSAVCSVAAMAYPFHGSDQFGVLPTAGKFPHDAAAEHHNHPITDGQLVQLVRDEQHRRARLRDGLEPHAP